MGIITVLWEKWTEFKRDFYKITVAAMIAPLMYLLVFGLGIQTMSHGEPYLNFLIPGIVSMVTMTGSFGAVAQNMSVQRLYEKALDHIQRAFVRHPVPERDGVLDHCTYLVVLCEKLYRRPAL